MKIDFLHCTSCGKCVSTGFIAVPTDTPDEGIIVRAWIECPECVEKYVNSDSDTSRGRRERIIEEQSRKRPPEDT